MLNVKIPITIKSIKFYFILNLFFFFPNSFSNGQSITNSIAVGGATSNSARFWVRTSSPAEINIVLSTSESFNTVIKGTPISTTIESDYAGIVDVTGLQPETKYYYHALVNGNNIDNIQRYFTTFPVPGKATTFKFAFGSCQQNKPNEGNVYREIIKHKPNFFLQLGDWGYPDTTDHIPSDSNFFSSDYSLVQKTYLSRFNISYPMDSLLKTTPVDYVYDDHDFMNDNSSATTSSFFLPYKPNDYSSDFVIREVSNPPNARLNSIKGYIENMPGYPLANTSRGIYHKFIYGNAEFFALDLRSQRNPNLEAFKKDSVTKMWEFDPGKNHTILGRDFSPGKGENQLDWFLSSLKNSSSDWKFIMSSVPFNIAQKKAIDLGLVLQDSALGFSFEDYPEGITGIFAPLELSDKWVGFPSDIDTVLNFINTNKIKNVIILSADSHNAAMDDGANAGLPEIMAGGLDIPNSREVLFLELIGIHIWDKGGQGITTSQFNNSFGLVTVFGKDSVNLSLIDEEGNKFASYTVISDHPVSVRNNEVKSNFPVTFQLFQNYPNPFNPSTTFSYHLSKSSNVKILIHNIIGQQVGELVEGIKPEGYHKTYWKPKNLPSGVYFYSIVASSINGETLFKKTLKMLLIK